MPVIVVAGEEEYQITSRVEALRDQLVDPAWASFNLTRIDNPDLRQVCDAAGMVPFGPGNKVVIFDQCSLFTKKRGASSDGDASSAKSAKIIDDFEQALDMVAENTYMIFSCIANFDKTLKTSKVVDKLAAAKKVTLESFAKMRYFAGASNDEYLTFVNREVGKLKKCIDDAAACYLAESTEVNLRQIVSEINKAAIYIHPEERITLEHVKTLSPSFSHAFVLLEQWALGQRIKVLETIRELHARHVSPHAVLGAAQTTLTKWVSYKTEYERMAVSSSGGGRDVRRREVPLKDVAFKIAGNSRAAFVVEMDLKRIRQLSLEYLIRKKRELTDLEFMLKSGQMAESHALEAFFTR